MPNSKTRTTIRMVSGREFVVDGTPGDILNHVVMLAAMPGWAVIHTYDGVESVINLAYVECAVLSNYHMKIHGGERSAKQ